jgi:hypothetical protein
MPRVSKATKDEKPRRAAKKRVAAATISGACLCGAVTIEVDVPVFWAWHDHSATRRKAHGAAYATYVGTYRSKCRIAEGEAFVSRFEEAGSGNVRSFCSRCGSPVSYERKRSPKWVNLPRALFAGRTGRDAKYHIAHEQLQDWAYLGAPVGPLKNYPGVMMERARKKSAPAEGLFDPDMFGPG